MKVAMVTDYGDITDQSFNQTTYEACKAYCEANGVDFTYKKPASDADADRVSSIEEAIEEGYNVIVMPGYAFGPAIVEVAPLYPDTKFVALDVSQADLGDDFDGPNVFSAVYQEELAGYMAGYAAVKLGYTKIGFLGGMAVPAVQRYGGGFVQGVDAAAGAQFGGQPGYDATEALLTLAENPNFKWDGDGYGNNSLKDGTVAAYFSGDWDYAGLYAALGDKLGAAAAPTVMIGGEAKQLLPYAGSKAVGVNPHADNMKAAMEFAAYLASVESQKLRFELRNIIPAATELQELDAIKNSIVAQAIFDTINGKSAFQPKIPEMDPVWGPVGTFGGNIKEGMITKDNIVESVDALDAQLNGDL